MSAARDAMARALVLLATGAINSYQLVVRSMYTREHCRFYPSCSDYALQALFVHGPFRGLWLAVRRIGRCHPFNPGGVDHVPQPVEQRPRVLAK